MTADGKFKKPKRERVRLEMLSVEEQQATTSLLGKLLGSTAVKPEELKKIDLTDDQIDLNADQIDTGDQQKIESTPALSDPVTELPRHSDPVTELPRHSVPPSINNPGIELPRHSVPPLRQKGYLSPNWLDDEVMPKLQLAEQVLLRRLYRLSYGFNRQITDPVSVAKLAEKCNLSETGIKKTIKTLEERGLISIERDLSGNPQGGNRYIVLTKPSNNPGTELPRHSVTPSLSADINDHDDFKHDNHHQEETMMIYQSITGNSWAKSDQPAYEKIKHLSTAVIEQGIRIAMSRAGSRPGSLAYFVKEILAIANPAPASIAQRRRELAAIIARVRSAHTGQTGYSIADFSADVKEACARDGVVFDHSIFNELVG